MLPRVRNKVQGGVWIQPSGLVSVTCDLRFLPKKEGGMQCWGWKNQIFLPFFFITFRKQLRSQLDDESYLLTSVSKCNGFQRHLVTSLRRYN